MIVSSVCDILPYYYSNTRITGIIDRYEKPISKKEILSKSNAIYNTRKERYMRLCEKFLLTSIR